MIALLLLAALQPAPVADQGLWSAFHAQAGIDRIVDDFVVRASIDARIGTAFRRQDLVQLRHRLKTQLCAVLGGGCILPAGPDSVGHDRLGGQAKDMTILTAHLREAMRTENVPASAQDRLVARLASTPATP